MKNDFLNIEKIKNYKNYLSLNIMSFVGYLVFANALFTVFYAKPILNDRTGLDEMFYGVAYFMYTFKIILIQIILSVIFYCFYKLEKYILKKKEKNYYININNYIFNFLFYTGFILFLSPFFIFYKPLVLLFIMFLDVLFDLIGLSNFIIFQNILICIKEYSFIVFCLLISIYIFIKIKAKNN